MSLTFACVRTGTKYGPEYVERLVRGVRRNLAIDRAICITDRPETFEGVENVTAHPALHGWFAKMQLFDPAVRGFGNTLFLDLDTIVLGDLTPLAEWPASFGICGSFTIAAGKHDWLCAFGSCAMFFREGFGGELWDRFIANARTMMVEATHGDQQIIEDLYPDAPIFQSHLPRGFFLNYRDFAKYPDGAPPEARLAIFGGAKKPHNYGPEWLIREWER